MRLVNCTDKKTPKLAQFGLCDQSVGVGDELLTPGKSMEVKDADKAAIEVTHAHLFDTGALAWLDEEVIPAPPETQPAPLEEVVEAAPKNALVDLAKDSKKGR